MPGQEGGGGGGGGGGGSGGPNGDTTYDGDGAIGLSGQAMYFVLSGLAVGDTLTVNVGAAGAGGAGGIAANNETPGGAGGAGSPGSAILIPLF